MGRRPLALAEGRDLGRNLGPGGNTIVLKVGRTLRIRFRIEEHAELTAVGCDPALSAAIQDCEVAFVPAGASGSLSVTDPVEETLAGKVQSPPMAEGVYLTLRLLQNDAFPAADIPEGNQLPYFVDVTAVDAAGSPVTFVGAGASLTLCQVEEPPAEAHLKLFRVDDGGASSIHEATTPDASGWCGGNSGLIGTGITGFSTWGATPVNLPDLVVSSIVIPNTPFYYGAVPWTWVSFNVTNAGTGPLSPLSLPTDPRGLHVLRADIVNATLNGVPTFRDGYFNIPISDPLGPGESVTFAFAVGQDEYWLPLGTWVIKVKVDSDEKVLEEDETNNVSDPLTFEVMEPPLSDFLIDFENEIVGFTPALPPLGVTYGFIYPGEIFVRESVGAAPNRYASFEALGSSAGPGAPDMHVKLLPRPTSGVYLVSWKGQFLTGASGGGVGVRDGSNRILGSMDFQDDGSVTYRGSAIGAYTMGSWQDFGMLVDLENREVSYLIAGVIVHGPVAFVESSASAEIGRISVELFLDNAQTFWWDDVALTRR